MHMIGRCIGIVIAFAPSLVTATTPFVPALAAPPYTIYPNTSNVFGRGQVNRSAGVVRYLGRFSTEQDCLNECLSFTDPSDGAICNSFTYHHANYPSPDFAGACYAIGDHSWLPVVDNAPSAPITSGRIQWPNSPCGSGSATGCQWLADPVCLAPGNTLSQVSMTPAQAALACASLSDCVAWTFSGARNQTGAVMVTLKNSTGEVRNGGSGCWAFRKYFPTGHDAYRTGFHFQPPKNWMNDPNGPMFDAKTGLYHLFYQWNPQSNVGFSDMHWGHAVSKDMLKWRNLPIALYPDTGSCGGEWSGSATVDAPGGLPILSYSVQCNSYFGQAVPADPSDALLVNWTANHIVGHKAPNTGGFRDPSTAWLGPDGKWRQLLACGGASCLYESGDFKTWQYVGHMFGTGKGSTWEMPDIVNLTDGKTLFMKVGMENGTDYWTTGSFSYESNNFTTGVGVATGAYSIQQQCDYGAFYSSKTFAGAPEKVLIGWVGEGADSPMKDWAGLQSIPRAITADPARPGRVLFYPIDLTALHGTRVDLGLTPLPSGGTVKVHGMTGLQLDLLATFQGPLTQGTVFGLGVFAVDGDLSTMTNVTVTIVDSISGILAVGAHRGIFPLAKTGGVTLRVLVDRSIVEGFVDDGTAVATTRAYPGSQAATSVYVTNGGTTTVQLTKFEGYVMQTSEPPSIEELKAHAREYQLTQGEQLGEQLGDIFGNSLGEALFV